MATFARIVLRLIEDALLRCLVLLARSDESLRAENLVLRRDLPSAGARLEVWSPTSMDAGCAGASDFCAGRIAPRVRAGDGAGERV